MIHQKTQESGTAPRDLLRESENLPDQRELLSRGNESQRKGASFSSVWLTSFPAFNDHKATSI